MTQRMIIAFVFALVLPGCALAQGNMPAGSSAQMGTISHQEDPTKRAAEACSRGLREMRKARDAKDPADQRKHYIAAQEQFGRSLKLARTFDALLGLGQASLALGDAQGARSSCMEALGLKADSAEAKGCADQAAAALGAPAAPPVPAPAAPKPPARSQSDRAPGLAEGLIGAAGDL